MGHYGKRAVDRCNYLAQDSFSEIKGILFRFWLGDAYRRAVKQVAHWMEEAGMTVRYDAMGSIIGRYEATHRDAPALVIGSHLDTVKNGGAFDGILGVMLGIEVVAALRDRQQRYPFAIEVVGFGDEEGSRFPAPMFSSRAMAGSLEAVPDGITDERGMSVAQAMEAFGLDPQKVTEAARHKKDVLAFIEAHIEQGPCIEAEDGAVAVVTAIASQIKQRVVLRGQGSHAGTTPMGKRRDALAGAAEMIGFVEQCASQRRSNAVATVGQLMVAPNVSNVIAQDVWFSLDIRAETDEERDVLAHDIQIRCRESAKRRNLDISFEATQYYAASACDSILMRCMEQAVETVTGRPAQKLLSGAGHDAMALAALCPTSMLFIRSPNGLSHHPDEAVRVCDVETAHQALMTFVEEFAAL
ncbi:allantoate amidohydrolase [Saccharibacter sp. 17.LH.SD]|uniref:allantoate amidohydrolase n=1 Tax=Saccharibacter sp. 17.LH.SD TaxID=2689393 RepID=UPI00136DBA56|nr:allantoate amidohydrolase [Saccharibacter sp. 17.LH.SD]MXV43706.1 allantoate amidohydrolase [Saccharibacter sp. 17.LH.SD]